MVRTSRRYIDMVRWRSLYSWYVDRSSCIYARSLHTVLNDRFVYWNWFLLVWFGHAPTFVHRALIWRSTVDQFTSISHRVFLLLSEKTHFLHWELSFCLLCWDARAWIFVTYTVDWILVQFLNKRRNFLIYSFRRFCSYTHLLFVDFLCFSAVMKSDFLAPFFVLIYATFVLTVFSTPFCNTS